MRFGGVNRGKKWRGWRQGQREEGKDVVREDREGLPTTREGWKRGMKGGRVERGREGWERRRGQQQPGLTC